MQRSGAHRAIAAASVHCRHRARLEVGMVQERWLSTVARLPELAQAGDSRTRRYLRPTTML
jgi:hypothetical protein